MCFFENKKTSRRCAILWSTLAFLSGGAVIYFSIMLMWADVLEKVEEHIEYMEKYNVRSYLFFVLFTLALFITCFGCFGMLFKWMRNRCCTVLFGTCLLPLWVAAVGIGAGAIYVSFISADEFENECKELRKKEIDRFPDFSTDRDLLSVNLNIYRDIQTDKYMCSRDCPCDNWSNKAEWESMDPETLTSTYGRSQPF